MPKKESQFFSSGKESVEKRFVLSKEEFAQERIGTIKESIKELKQKNPEVLSMCMFGSSVTGKARIESDIDGYLFIDADAVAKKFNIKQENTGSKISDYGQEVRNKLKEKLGLSDEQVKHIRTRPISERIIDQYLDELTEQIKKLEDYRQRFKQWEAADPQISGKVEDIEKLTEYYEQKPEHPNLPYPSVNLFAMFHLEIGGGIRKYREYLINKLATLGEVGERAWGEIIKTTEELEQHLQTNTEKRYPRTIEEAKKVYGRITLHNEKIEEKDKNIEEARKNIGIFFDTQEDGQKRIKNILSKVEPFLKSDLIDGDKVRQSLEECSVIKDREEFIEKVLSSIEPISDLKKNNPEAFGAIERGVFKEINEIFSYGESKDFVHIHLAPAKELGIGKLRRLAREGLEELAKIIKENKEIKRVEAISWIVAEHPEIMERLGFTVRGEIDEKMRLEYFANDDRKIGEATMSREDFLNKYLKER